MSVSVFALGCSDAGSTDGTGDTGDTSGESESGESSESGDDVDTSESESDGESDGESDSSSEDTTEDDETDTSVEPDPRQLALETYAPRIWLHGDESYFPSSLEFTWPETTRFADGNGEHWVRTIAPLGSPSDTLPYFAGELESAPVYGYYADKGDGVVDLVYFVWFPYNRGKEVANTIWGNHVGDWEHVTVRLTGDLDDGLVPDQVYLSAHNFGGAYPWGDGQVELHDGTHPVVYAAWGSHGFWAQPGDHVYMEIGIEDPVFDTCITLVCADLTDSTEAGIAWDTWEDVYGMDFFAEEGLAGLPWPAWMSDAFTDPGAGDPSVPGDGPIFRWGNAEDCSVLGIPIDITDLIGVCRLEDGPTGPVSKNTWGPELQ